ncbi:hypothetical protein [Burkholderia stagnalis]|uniref:hypothetical protein n=1 Tax=Burkholderia stagnalis TaxID=1503054 RepID=UPI000F60280F|nr:hypothetical protein [Burkholderia stagnalis]
MQNSPSEQPITTRQVAKYLYTLRRLLSAEMMRCEALARSGPSDEAECYRVLIEEIDRAAQVLWDKKATL